jgi:DNA-directed RNA polymerase subunit RPC12/RpoP
MYPTWSDVGVPQQLVDYIKELPPGGFLDSLVHQFVYRGTRRPSYLYRCARCGYKYRPERALEEIACCPQCQNTLLTRSSRVSWFREVNYYSRSDHRIPTIINIVYNSYRYYFGEWITSVVEDCGWNEEDDLVHFKFFGGERFEDVSPKMCLLKAAVLCPYLWDTTFNWNVPRGDDCVHVEVLGPLFSSLRNFRYEK